MLKTSTHPLVSGIHLTEEKAVVLSQDVEHEKLIVTQANELALSAQQLTVQEKRLAFLLMALVRKEDENFKLYYVPVTAIAEYLEISNKDYYKRLKGVCSKFMSRVLCFEDGLGGWMQIHWVDRCRYLTTRNKDNPLGVACLEMRLHVDLAPLLLNLKERFGSVAFRQLALMDRFTSMRLAEILFHASYSLKKKQLYFILDDLKKRLGLEGRYKNFFDFRRDVLLKAQDECKEKAPLIFTWELKKQGKKVIGVHFFLSKNKHAKIPPPPPIEEAKENPQMSIDLPEESSVVTPDQEQVDIVLERNGVDKAGRTHLIKTYDSERIIQNAQIAIERHQEGKINNLGAATVAAIKNDYRKKLSPHEKAQEEQQALKKKEAAAREAQKRKEEEAANKRAELDGERRDAALSVYLGMSSEEKKGIFESIKGKSKGFERDKIVKGGEKDMMFLIRLAKELNDQLPPHLQEPSA